MNTSMTTDTPAAGEMPVVAWKFGNEFAPYHPQASHINPDHRDGWNACYRAAKDQLAAKNAEIARLQAESDRTARNRDMWKGQCERQAEQLTALRTALIDLHAVASVEEDKDYAAVTNAAAVIDSTKGEAP